MIERRGERGSAAFELPLILGLVLVPFGVLVLSISTWVERQTAARDAAGETARFAVVAGPERLDEVEPLLREIEQGYGLPAGSLRLQFAPSDVPGEAIISQVTVSMPGAVIPLFGSFGDVSWTAEHVERVPDYGATS